MPSCTWHLMLMPDLRIVITAQSQPVTTPIRVQKTDKN